MKAITAGIAATAIFGLYGCGLSRPTATTQALSAETTPSPEVANWVKTETTSQMDGTKQIVLMTSAAGNSHAFLIARFKGRALDVYVNTGEVVDDESASVRIKFDDGAPVKQTWTRSKDYAAVFSPSPFDLLKGLESSNKFYLEYHPYQRVPETVTFNVAGLTAVLPKSEMDVQKKNKGKENAASAEGIAHRRTEPNVDGGDISTPAVIFKVEPEYSEEARKAKYGGTVTLSITVDTEGRARDIRVVKSLGMGLDEKAVEAVQKWRFKPGMNKGVDVNASASIDVDFR